jgi:hypothetical protein
MSLSTKGGLAMAALLCADASVPAYNATNARIGVGDSNTAFSAAHTDLQAASNKFRKLVNGAPSVNLAAGEVTFSATFANAEAVFAINEIGLFNAASGDTMMSRKVVSLGSKPNNEAWTIDLICNTAVGA